jgi:hypothetical protein
MRNARLFLTVLILAGSLGRATPVIPAEETSPPSVPSHEVNVVHATSVAAAIASAWKHSERRRR